MSQTPLIAVTVAKPEELRLFEPALACFARLGIVVASEVIEIWQGPERLVAWVRACEERGVLLHLVAAGNIANLPGLTAAAGRRPVLGVALATGAFSDTELTHLALDTGPGAPVMAVEPGAGATMVAAALRVLALTTPEAENALKTLLAEDSVPEFIEDQLEGDIATPILSGELSDEDVDDTEVNEQDEDIEEEDADGDEELAELEAEVHALELERDEEIEDDDPQDDLQAEDEINPLYDDDNDDVALEEDDATPEPAFSSDHRSENGDGGDFALLQDALDHGEITATPAASLEDSDAESFDPNAFFEPKDDPVVAASESPASDAPEKPPLINERWSPVNEDADIKPVDFTQPLSGPLAQTEASPPGVEPEFMSACEARQLGRRGIDADSPDPILIEDAVDCLLEGGVIALPTETVYGLAVDATNPAAVAKLFELKGNPRHRALSLMIDSPRLLSMIACNLTMECRRLMEAFWPGPLTLIMEKRGQGFRHLNEESTIGVRLPDHSVPLSIIQGLARPLACTSANLSGQPDSRHPDDVEATFGERLNLLLDCGALPTGGPPSTVIDVTADPFRILREGAISHDQMAAILGDKLEEKQ